MSAPLLELRGLDIGWPGRCLARGLDLDLEAGTTVAVVGDNGAGKSTLLATLAGLQRPLAGSVHTGGRPIEQLALAARARAITWCGARFERPLAMSGIELVRLGRLPHGGRRSDDDAAVARALEATGSTELAERAVSELSDGELQRLWLSRALAQASPVMLFDEPTAHLDVVHRHHFTSTLRRLAAAGHVCVIATHDLELALELPDRLLVIASGSFHHGGPEDLALAGVLAQTLAGGTLELDPQRLRFRPTAAGPRVWLDIPAGPVRGWTHNAIERAGCRLGAPGDPTVGYDGGTWRLPTGEVVASLAALVRHLRDATAVRE
jgi:iron complex transport system ATP-binding protein